MAELSGADTCVAAVQTVPEAVADPQYEARGAFVRAVHPEHGEFRQVGRTLAGMERTGSRHPVRPADVTDTDELLAAAGLSPDEVAKLRDAGVVA